MEERRDPCSSNRECRDRQQLRPQAHPDKREEFPGQAEHESGKNDRGEREALARPQAEQPAEQCRTVMLERVVVVEPLVRQPVIDRREFGTGQIVCNAMKVGQAVVVLDHLWKRQPPQGAIEQRAEKDDLARHERLFGKPRPLGPDHEERQRRQRKEERVERAKTDEMLKREKH
jgi:hypothetical protein